MAVILKTLLSTLFIVTFVPVVDLFAQVTFTLLIVALFLGVAVVTTFAFEKYLTILFAFPVNAVVDEFTS